MVPAHNLRSGTRARRQAAFASPSSAGWALTGPGGWISLACEPAVTIVALGAFGGPEVHPARTTAVKARRAPMRKDRGVRCVDSPSRPMGIGRLLQIRAMRANPIDSERRQEGMKNFLEAWLSHGSSHGAVRRCCCKHS